MPEGQTLMDSDEAAPAVATPAAAAPAPAFAAAAGPKFVTVSAAGGSIRVITEQESEDGRERRPNGDTPIADGKSQHFIVGPGRSLRIVEG